MPSLQVGRRAAGVEAVVGPAEAAGRTGDQGGDRRTEAYPVRAGELGEDLSQLDAEHPRLVCLAAALVGSSDSGVALRGLQGIRGRARSSDSLPQVRIAEAGAGDRRARHMVQLGFVAFFDSGLA